MIELKKTIKEKEGKEYVNLYVVVDGDWIPVRYGRDKEHFNKYEYRSLVHAFEDCRDEEDCKAQ